MIVEVPDRTAFDSYSVGGRVEFSIGGATHAKVVIEKVERLLASGQSQYEVRLGKLIVNR